MKVDERIVKKFFEKIGKVKQVIMIRDKYTNRHKGFAYVEMKALDSIPLVLMLHNTVPDFQRFPILIKASEAEKNFLAKQEIAAAAASSAAMVKERLYVGNLPEVIGEADIKEVLKTFGTIDSANIQRDENGKSKGYGFVKFARAEDAANALNRLEQQPLELLGNTLKFGFVNDAPATQGNWKLDDDEGKTGVSLDSNSRLALMQRLGGGAMGGEIPPAIMPPAVLPPVVPLAPPVMPPLPTPALPPIAGTPGCLLKLNNMFDPATETEPGWELDIKEDTEQECSKFGPVVFCHVDPVSPNGNVYIVFADQTSASKAAAQLHGRGFAYRTITVEYMQPDVFLNQFPHTRDAFPSGL
jgi:RNA-binding protein 39